MGETSQEIEKLFLFGLVGKFYWQNLVLRFSDYCLNPSRMSCQTKDSFGVWGKGTNVTLLYPVC